MSDSGEDEALRLTLSPPGSASRRWGGERASSSSSSTAATASYTDESPQFNEIEKDDDAGVTFTDHGNHAVREVKRKGKEGRGARRRPQTTSEPATGPKEEEVEPPFPWATNRRATVHSLEVLARAWIHRIEGEVMCKRCDGLQRIDVDIEGNFHQISTYFLANKDSMHDRAPKMWMVPRLLDCSLCHQVDCVKPVIDGRKRQINWLFLLLTQTLGLCTLDQLKYFCKHNRRHRTGAKDRVLYLTFVGLLKQLNPSGPYD